MVKAGDVVKVKVMEVDAARKRIALSMKSGAGASADVAPRSAQQTFSGPRASAAPVPKQPESGGETALAAALRRAKN